MSKIMLAFGSFIVGASVMFLMLSGSHTSTFAQVLGGPGGVLVSAEVPTVPPANLHFSKATWSGLVQQLDGVDCTDCVFNNVSFTYGGGAFNFNNVAISKNFRLTLTGAAANTIILLRILEAISAAKPPIPPQPQTPIQRTAIAKQTVTISLASPYGFK